MHTLSFILLNCQEQQLILFILCQELQQKTKDNIGGIYRIMHTCTHTKMHTCAHTNIHTCIHVHTCAPCKYIEIKREKCPRWMLVIEHIHELPKANEHILCSAMYTCTHMHTHTYAYTLNYTCSDVAIYAKHVSYMFWHGTFTEPILCFLQHNQA